VLEAALDLVRWVRNLVGVVDDARREEDDQLVRALLMLFEPNAAPNMGMRCRKGTPLETCE